MAGTRGTRDDAIMTCGRILQRGGFTGLKGLGATRDFTLLEIHPTRIRNLEGWTRRVNYQGKQKEVLKGLEDARGGNMGGYWKNNVQPSIS